MSNKCIIPLTLKCLRISKRLTQQELADELGYGTQTEISMIESGSRQPTESMIIRLGKYFKCPGEILFLNIQENIENGNVEKFKLKIS